MWFLDVNEDGNVNEDVDDVDDVIMDDVFGDDIFGVEAEMREGGVDIAEDGELDEEWVNVGGDDEDEVDLEMC